MAQLTFDDLIPAQGGSSQGLSFDDLIPATSTAAPPVAAAPLGISAADTAGMPMPSNLGEARREGQLLQGQALAGADTATFGLYPRITGQREALAKFQKENPEAGGAGSAVGGMIGAGGIAKGVGRLLPGLANAWNSGGWAGRTLGTALGGGAYQAAQEAGHLPANAVTQDYLDALKGGFKTGAAWGGGLGVGGSMLGALARAGAPGVQGVGRGAANLLDLAGAGNPRVAQGMERLGPQATMADTSPSLTGTVQGAAGRIGPAQDQILDFYKYRTQGRDPGTLGPNDPGVVGRDARLGADVQQNLGIPQPPTAPQGGESLNKTLSDARKEITSPLYKEALDGAPPVKIQPIVDWIQLQLQKASGPTKSFLLRTYNDLVDPIRGGGVLTKTDAETIHNAKITAQKTIKQGDPGLGVLPGATNMEQGTAKAVVGQLGDALKTQVPGYADAAAKYEEYSKLKDNLAFGVNALNRDVWPQHVAQQMQIATPAGQEAIRQGNLGAFGQVLGNAGNDLSAVRKFAGGDQDWNLAKTNLIHGEQPMENVRAGVNREETFANTGNQLGGSRTAPMLASMKAVDEAGHLPNITPAANWQGMLASAGQHGGRWLMNKIAGSRNDTIRNQLAQAFTMPTPDQIALSRALADRGQTSVGVRNAVTDPRMLSLLLSRQAGPQ